MNTWKTMESAPKDKRILLNIGGQIMFSVGRWDADEFTRKPRPYWRADVEAWMGKLWMRDHQPTHWMDPMAPTDSTKGKTE